ncbi:hypothetical protein ACIBHX_48035 [Nonomuraea sp. NPDC050536]|uniref:hypothetical protein n=1 Tax=Nonomuraea sp. NPDC050536 TaxID=3364366 RepID=UPI0037C788E6
MGAVVPLSAGTVAATVFVDLKHDYFFYLVDGRRISSFSWFAYSLRDGFGPDPLLADVHELGSTATSSPNNRCQARSPWPSVPPECHYTAPTSSDLR